MVNKKYEYPSISMNKDFFDSLETRSCDDLTTLYIDGISVASYSPTKRKHFGKAIDINKEDLEGRLFLNTDFFRQFDIKKNPQSKSDMENIAKTFFKVNGENYVGLVQYLCEDGESNEHYHTLREAIVQLGGRSLIEMRPTYDDTEVKRVEMSAGGTHIIDPGYSHIVKTIDEGSITVPIKKTDPKRKDHLYCEKSIGRITSEVKRLLTHPHYNSGDEIYCALGDYYRNLKPEQEKINFQTLIELGDIEEKNPNIKEIFSDFIDEYF